MKLSEINVCLINLDERKERLERTEKEFKRFGIAKYNRISAVKHEFPFKGIAQSHLNCIQLAKDNNWPCVLICEDDVYFPSERAREYADICMNNIPTDWNILLGGVYHSKQLIPYNNCWSMTKEFAACHFYIVNANCYDYILTTYDFNTHIDRWYAKDTELKRYKANTRGALKCYVATPFFSIQHNGWSDNVQRETNYDSLLKNFPILK